MFVYTIFFIWINVKYLRTDAVSVRHWQQYHGGQSWTPGNEMRDQVTGGGVSVYWTELDWSVYWLAIRTCHGCQRQRKRLKNSLHEINWNWQHVIFKYFPRLRGSLSSTTNVNLKNLKVINFPIPLSSSIISALFNNLGGEVINVLDSYICNFGVAGSNFSRTDFCGFYWSWKVFTEFLGIIKYSFLIWKKYVLDSLPHELP